ncbi:hypothetical protein ACFPRL_02985 [Pseudoclavibacter helvolus]
MGADARVELRGGRLGEQGGGRGLPVGERRVLERGREPRFGFLCCGSGGVKVAGEVVERPREFVRAPNVEGAGRDGGEAAESGVDPGGVGAEAGVECADLGRELAVARPRVRLLHEQRALALLEVGKLLPVLRERLRGVAAEPHTLLRLDKLGLELLRCAAVEASVKSACPLNEGRERDLRLGVRVVGLRRRGARAIKRSVAHVVDVVALGRGRVLPAPADRARGVVGQLVREHKSAGSKSTRNEGALRGGLGGCELREASAALERSELLGDEGSPLRRDGDELGGSFEPLLLAWQGRGLHLAAGDVLVQQRASLGVQRQLGVDLLEPRPVLRARGSKLLERSPLVWQRLLESQELLERSEHAGRLVDQPRECLAALRGLFTGAARGFPEVPEQFLRGFGAGGTEAAELGRGRIAELQPGLQRRRGACALELAPRRRDCLGLCREPGLLVEEPLPAALQLLHPLGLAERRLCALLRGGRRRGLLGCAGRGRRREAEASLGVGQREW